MTRTSSSRKGVAASTPTDGGTERGLRVVTRGADETIPSTAERATRHAAPKDRSASKQLMLRITEPVVVTAPAAVAVKLGKQFLVAFEHRRAKPVTYTLYVTAVDALSQRARQELKLTVRP